jgi:hypothetical protein
MLRREREQLGPSYDESDSALTICLVRESETNQCIEREGSVANP